MFSLNVDLLTNLPIRPGSLSTFTQVINAWRAEKATTNEEVKAHASEIVEDRASVLDHGLSAVADTLKSMRVTLNRLLQRSIVQLQMSARNLTVYVQMSEIYTRRGGHCIKVTLLSGSREHYRNIRNFSWVSGL